MKQQDGTVWTAESPESSAMLLVWKIERLARMHLEETYAAGKVRREGEKVK